MLVIYFAVPVRPRSGAWEVVFGGTLSLLAVIALVLAIKKQVLHQFDQPDAPLGGLAVGIVAGLLLFALIDYSVAVYSPGEFDDLNTRVDALYFALATLLTVGFGDVSAQGQFARGLLCVQMVFNVAVLATTASMLGRQVGRRAAAQRERRRG
ncbi:MAG: two pore domain potassium channel family protein [Hamadaea sp.]|nr:two pore domain potassium channel family protein [Hamadaea sp.]